MANHVKTHTGEKEVQCHLCNYTCMVKSQLTRHLMMHSDEKPYHCTESGCPYQTRTQSELTVAVPTCTFCAIWYF